jgi:hypothetical protein
LRWLRVCFLRKIFSQSFGCRYVALRLAVLPLYLQTYLNTAVEKVEVLTVVPPTTPGKLPVTRVSASSVQQAVNAVYKSEHMCL